MNKLDAPQERKYKKLIAATADQWKSISPLLIQNRVFVPFNEYNPILTILGNEAMRIKIIKKINYVELLNNSTDNMKVFLMAKLFENFGMQISEVGESENDRSYEFGFVEDISEKQQELIQNLFNKIGRKKEIEL